MLWIIPTWIGTVIIAALFGYYLRGLKQQITVLTEIVKSKSVEPIIEPEPTSTLIDPTDPVKEAIYERDKMMARLNPDE